MAELKAKVIMFSSSQCAHCEQAKTLLHKHNIAFDERNIETSDKDRQDLMTRLPTVRALPQLFVKDVSIGSTEDLQLLIQKGKLEGLL